MTKKLYGATCRECGGEGVDWDANNDEWEKVNGELLPPICSTCRGLGMVYYLDKDYTEVAFNEDWPGEESYDSNDTDDSGLEVIKEMYQDLLDSNKSE